MSKKRKSESAASGPSSTRDNIKKVATDLLIRQGVHGTSFRSIAERLGITTTNIHYHFGNKQKLVEEVTRDYVHDACRRHEAIWLNPETTLAEKLQEVVAYNRTRYKRFNRGKQTGKSWSLIGRLRLDSDVLSQATRATLASFSTSVHAAIRVAVDTAWRKGELCEDAPREDIAFLLINIVNSSSVFTRDAGSFERLELFFDAFSRVMLSAYAPRAPAKSGAK